MRYVCGCGLRKTIDGTTRTEGKLVCGDCHEVLRPVRGAAAKAGYRGRPTRRR